MQALWPISAPVGAPALVSKSTGILPLSSLLGTGPLRFSDANQDAASICATKVEPWEDLVELVHEFELAVTKNVAPYPFTGQAVRFEAPGGSAALQILAVGHFSHMHLTLGRTRATVYEGSLNSGLKEFDWESASNQLSTSSIALKVYAAARCTLSLCNDAWKLSAVEQCQFPFVLAINATSYPESATVTPCWGIPATERPWSQPLYVCGGRRFGNHLRQIAGGHEVQSKERALGVGGWTPRQSVELRRAGVVSSRPALGSQAAFGTTQFMGGALVAASAAVMQSPAPGFDTPHAEAQRRAVFLSARQRQARAAEMSPGERRELLFGSEGGRRFTTDGVDLSMLKGQPLARERMSTEGPITPLRVRMSALELNLARNRAQLQVMRPHLDEVLAQAAQE